MTYQLTKEQAYDAYVTYQNTTGNPVVAIESFDDTQLETWQKVANVFASLVAVPSQSEAA